jgi:hypothetical protein
MAVRARGHGRRTRQRDAGDVDGRIAAGTQPRRIPDGRHAEIEVHVVGDERHARLRMDAGHGPAVAAGLGLLAARLRPRRDETQQRGKRPRQHAGVAGAGGVHAARIGGIVRRVPVSVAGVDEGDQPARRRRRGGHARRAFQSPPPDLVDYGVVLQLPPHRVHHQHRVFRQPGARSRAQQQVLPGARVETGETRVHAAGIGFDDGALVGRRGFEDAPGHGAKAEAPGARVLLQRHRAEQLGQLAAGEAPRQVHLEKAVLRVRVTGGERQVGARAGRDDGYAARIALERRGLRQTGRRHLAVERRQAAMQRPPRRAEGDGGEHRDADQGPSQPAQPTHRWA